MKKTALLGGILVLFFAIGAQAQEPEKKQNDPYSPYNNPTVTAITSKYTLKEMPGQLTVEKIFPAIGKYEFTAEGATSPTQITVTLDTEVKGIVWVEGLPQGKFKALLRQSPATYKIPVQKNEEDKEVAEGTLIYDQDAKTLSIILGKPYNDIDPVSAFAAPVEDETANVEEMKVKTKKSKTKVKKEEKVKPVVYVATKIEMEQTIEPSSSMN
jgi:hypothetical protein